MSAFERFAAGEAVLEVGGCADAPVVPPIIRGRPENPGGDSPLAPAFLAKPREDFPLLARPAPGSSLRDPKAWAAAARRLLDERLEEVGAVLLRGLPLGSPADFSSFFHALGYEPMPYDGAATRTEVAPGVFTPNLAAPAQRVMMHNDMSHMRRTPAHLFLFCDNPPPEGAGGETPIARNKDWSAELGPELLARFADRGLERRMNCPSRRDSPKSSRAWENRFGTDEPREVESICAQQGDVVEWRPDGGLTTQRVVPAFREHDGEKIWFCSPQCTHPGAAVEFAYGDGEPIEPEVLERIDTSQWKIAVAFSWRKGDVLCLDNFSCQHGRMSYSEGVDRRVFVALATPRRNGMCESSPAP